MDQGFAETASDRAVAKVSGRHLAMLWAAAAGAAALHNLEEWLLDMTGWIAGHSWLPGRSLHGDQAEFAVVLALVTVAVFAIAGVAVAVRPRWSAEVLVCVAYALMVNGASHAVLSLLSWHPMPGVFSGIVVLLPLGMLVVHMLPPVRWTVPTIVMTVIAAVGITAGAFALASVLTGIEWKVSESW
ncbi:HXXEE domain-containing protein [Brevibacterium album]|uniref:HXXEE domain-containing protein n=1 Tax=Brevibacterium album TaxID=417948 RepID=UPI0004172F03|nr:HXXEE domain-containing protein [Brevibacterium album]